MAQGLSMHPFLWFDKEAEEAANRYVEIFNGTLKGVHRYPKGGPAPEGSVMTVEFELLGLPFVALNAGPQFKFNPAVSFTVLCDGQEEIDRYWDALLADGGKTMACGWLTDKFGLSWQINPRNMGKLISGGTPEQNARAMQAMMGQIKIDIAEIERARDGE